MSEIWVWDNLYHVYRCCLGAVLLRDNKWYFYPYHSYKTGSEKWTIGPYAKQSEAKKALYEWHSKVAEFVSMLGKHEGTEIMDSYVKQLAMDALQGFYNKSGTELIFTIRYNPQAVAESHRHEEWLCYFPYIPEDASESMWKKAPKAVKILRQQIEKFIKVLAEHENKGMEI